MNQKKIYILGSAGSGKTFLANKISNKLKIPHYDLDDIKWEIKYTKKREKEKRLKILEKITKKNKWIIEGPYTSFIEPTIKKAELIIWLRSSKNTLSLNILKRHMKKEREIRNNFLYTLKLMKMTRKYNENNPHFKEHEKLLKKFKNKTMTLKSNKDIKDFIKSINF